MSKIRVLIADDDADILKLVTMILEEAGKYDIVPARDGITAWRLFEEVRPRLVITDLNMPGINGLDLTEKIRNHDELGHTPVIILTGTTRDDDLPPGFWRNGTKATVYIEKPVQIDNFLQAVQRALLPKEANPLPPGKGYY